ncbi:MAG TPA: hypothetical protein VK202_01715 [Bacteroidia bacterium]|nr:hypothetical protein [Bacteroidia bacterium]
MSTIRHINKFRIFIIFGLFIGVFLYLKVARNFFDRPFILADETQTIEAVYVAWACDCPNWLSTHHYTTTPDYEAREEDCFFIEPADTLNALPPSMVFSVRTKIKFTGRFYVDKGIPESYVSIGDFKPAHARVFRYEEYELISN